MKNHIKLCCKILKIPIIFIICMGFMLMVSCNKEQHKHSLVNIPSIQATCIQDGQIEYWVCEQCDKCFSDRAATIEISRETTIVPVTGHNYDYNKPEWKWNGYTKAVLRFICKNDSTHQVSFDAAVTSTSIPSTCETDGKATYTASVEVNSKTYSDQKEQVLPKTGHQYDFTNAVWIWDGFESAKLKAICNCDESHVQEYVATITSTTIEPSCTSAGKTIYTATVSIDDVVYTNQKEEIIPATGHNYDYEHLVWEWDEKTKAVATCLNDSTHQVSFEAIVTSLSIFSTCEKDGKSIYTASVQVNSKTYSNQKVEIIPKTGHRIVEDAAIEATCEEDGLTAGTHCSVCCKVILKQEVVPKTGHQYDLTNAVWIWDDFESAKLKATCTHDTSHIQEYVAIITSTTIEPSCTSAGKITYTASVEVNSKTYSDQKIETLPIDETIVQIPSFG